MTAALVRRAFIFPDAGLRQRASSGPSLAASLKKLWPALLIIALIHGLKRLGRNLSSMAL